MLKIFVTIKQRPVFAMNKDKEKNNYAFVMFLYFFSGDYKLHNSWCSAGITCLYGSRKIPTWPFPFHNGVKGRENRIWYQLEAYR